jgi:hypothetical protein
MNQKRRQEKPYAARIVGMKDNQEFGIGFGNNARVTTIGQSKARLAHIDRCLHR